MADYNVSDNDRSDSVKYGDFRLAEQLLASIERNVSIP